MLCMMHLNQFNHEKLYMDIDWSLTIQNVLVKMTVSPQISRYTVEQTPSMAYFVPMVAICKNLQQIKMAKSSAWDVFLSLFFRRYYNLYKK